MAISWHPGELEVQERAGKLEQGTRSVRMLREEIPEIAAGFVAAQPMIVVAGRDPDARVWVSALTGEPGFVSAPDPHRLRVAATPHEHDPLAPLLGRGGHVGTIALEPVTGRRMRVNGLATPEPGGFVVHAEQVFSNCPKYISSRQPLPERGPVAPQVTHSRTLTPAQVNAVEAADTFFIGTAHPDGPADASHKAGNPGFVRVDGPDRLRFPDYVGNSMFMTLGNLTLDPHVGLLFLDWASGDVFAISGRARVDWDPAAAAALPGAQRVVELEIDAVVETRDALSLRWTPPELSRFNPA